MDLAEYGALLTDVKTRVQGSRTRAVLAANRELLSLYWDVGRLVDHRQQVAGWGTGVVRRLSQDLRNELPDIKGFSERNIKRMVRFFREYPALFHGNPAIVPQPVAQLPGQSDPAPSPSTSASLHEAILSLPWGHNFVLLEKLANRPERHWYMQHAIAAGWSRSVLTQMIKSDMHARSGAAISNFEARLPAPQSDLVQETLKDPYIFDFLTLEAPFHERELETGLVRHLERFLIELGVGFAFVGRQYHVSVADDDFYIDLLFYHLRLRCYVVIELKTGAFKPEYAGKLNFYINIVDDRLRHADDQPTIGLILCQDKKQVLAEYALGGMDRPIGISEYELTRALPDDFQSVLPTVEQLESELTADLADDPEG